MVWEGIHVRLAVYSVVHMLKLSRVITKMIPVVAFLSLCLILITHFFKCGSLLISINPSLMIGVFGQVKSAQNK